MRPNVLRRLAAFTLVNRLFELNEQVNGSSFLRPARLNCVALEDRITPTRYWVELISPEEGDPGDAGATFTGSLTVNPALPLVAGKLTVDDASVTNPAEAVRRALIGTVTAHISSSSEDLAYSFGLGMSSTIPTAKGASTAIPYWVEYVSGTTVTVHLEDRATSTKVAPDCDYNDRSWGLTVTEVPPPSISVFPFGNAQEAGPVTGFFKFVRIALPGDLEQSVEATFRLTGVATPFTDYQLAGMSTTNDITTAFVRFEANQDVVFGYVVPVQDKLYDEGFESVIATITSINSPVYTVGTPSATITIADTPKPATPQCECDCECGVAAPVLGAGVTAPQPEIKSDEPVRYGDGVAETHVPGILTDAMGVPWGSHVSWSNGAGYADGRAGTGTQSFETLRLIQAFGINTIGLVTAADTAFYYDLIDGNYAARFYDATRLTHDEVNHEYVLTDASGAIKRFYDYTSNTPPARGGLLKSLADRAGNLTSVVTWNGTNPALVQRTVGNVTESFAYSYVTSGVNQGLLTNMIWSRSVGGSAAQAIRSVGYTYHNGLKSAGLARNLRSAEVLDAAGKVLDRAYYRYYTTDSATGYAGGLKYAVGVLGFDRVINASGIIASEPDPVPHYFPALLDGVSDAVLARFADHHFQYDSAR